jgi:hypothetical protein
MIHAHQNVRDVPIPRDAGKPFPRLLLSSFPGLLRDPASAENADKTSTKRRQKRECEFFSSSPTATYNFEVIRCLHFPATESPPLPRGEGQGEGQTGSSFCAPDSCQFASVRGRHRKSNKTERFRTKMPRAYCTPSTSRTELRSVFYAFLRGCSSSAKIEQNRTISDFSKIGSRRTNDLRRERPRSFDFQFEHSFVIRHSCIRHSGPLPRSARK